jgi:hypothetical protein
VLAAYVPGGLERSFEEFAQLRTEQGEGANRSTGRGSTVEEINEKYDSEFVGPPVARLRPALSSTLAIYRRKGEGTLVTSAPNKR